MYQALYRKWRPRTFDDVVGQNHITDTLKHQLESGRLSHAYLFTGTKGTGKTTCAKILAKAVNCEYPVKGEPCNRCPSCIGIDSGSILDVLEIDAASNNGVDQVRALRDEAVFTPAAVKKRVYIIDEVHMLSTPAFNALLKILEEPPSHLLFILATTELHKVPATIKSRCQQFAFKRIHPHKIAERLAYVAAQEGIEITDDGTALLARLADGSMRDAISLLDQCVTPGTLLDKEQVLSVLGLAGSIETARLMEDIADRRTEDALTGLGRLYEGGKDVAALMGELSVLCRDLLLCRTAPHSGAALLAGGYDEATLHQLSQKLTASRLAQILGLIQATMADFPRSGNRRTDAELCLIRLCDETLDVSVEGLNARLSHLEEIMNHLVLEKDMQHAAAPTVLHAVEQEDCDLPPWDEKESEINKLQEKKQVPVPTPEPEDMRKSVSDGFWPSFAAALRGKVSPAVYTYLKNPCFVTGTYQDGVLTLWADSDMTKRTVGKPEVLSTLSNLAEGRFGSPVKISLLVGKPGGAVNDVREEKHDNLDDLLALGRQFGNITIKE